MTTFDHPLGELHWDRYDPADALPALAAAERDALARLDAVAGAADPLLAFDQATAAYDFVAAVPEELAAMVGGAWREVDRATSERAARFRTAVLQRHDLYEAVRGARPAGAVGQRLRADLLREFERGGAHLERPARDRVGAINGRLAELSADYMANLQAAGAAAGVRTDDPAGLPRPLVGQARAAAAERGLPGWYVPYSEANATVVLREAADRELRAAMYRLDVTLAAAGNGPVVAEILALRQELAQLLGHPDFVQLRLAGRMVADPQALLDELAAAYRPQADREHAELVAFAREYTGDPALELTAADVDNSLDGFYAQRLRESRGLASGSAIRVPMELATRVMLDALAELYTVTFTPAPDASRWHEDVEAYDLHDAGGRHVARIWCDWYVRDGKNPGGWMGAPWFATGGAPHQLLVVTNFPRAGAELLDLRIMWHEFGHVLHYAFTRTRYRFRSPHHGARDFVEAPSAIMENWPMEPAILRRMGIDEQAAAAARAEERFRVASRKMARMARSAMDLAMHRGEDPLRTKQNYLPVPVDPADATAAHFPHLFAGGYGAGHYAYPWAGVLATDLFSRFAAEGILNRETGGEYAGRILAHGAERDPAELVRDFLGRDPGIDAVLARDGVR